MYQNIKYKGINVHTSDYGCADGELTDVMGMESNELGLHVPSPPRTLTELQKGEEVRFIHKTSDNTHNTHYIIQKGKSLLWMSDEDYIRTELTSNMTANDVKAVGNTLVVLTDNGLFYFLWKNGKYINLGQMPDTDIRFSLHGKMERDIIGKIQIHKDKNDSKKLVIDDADKEHVFGCVNKFIADYSVNRGRFIFPFLVRYAYRLYDGSLIRHSAPILMQCSDLISPCILGDNFGIDTDIDLRVAAVTHKLFYTALPNNIKDWSDIIKSVDIFISRPIYTYNQAGELEIAQEKNDPDNPSLVSSAQIPFATKSVSICKVDEDGVIVKDNLKHFLNCNQPRTFRDMYTLAYYNIVAPIIGGRVSDYLDEMEEVIKLPAHSREKVMKEIADTHNFYLLSSIPVDKLKYYAETDIKVPEDYLQSLVAREVMTDDYDSHCNLIPNTMFTYNSRLNIANIKRDLFKGYSPCASIQKTDGYYFLSVDNGGNVWKEFYFPLGDEPAEIRAFVFLRKGGKEYITETSASQFGYSTPIFYYYYPDKDAYKVVINVKTGMSRPGDIGNREMNYEIPLKPHDFLNGAVFCDTPGLERDFFYYYKDLTRYYVNSQNTDHKTIHEREFAAWAKVAATNGNDTAKYPIVKPTPTPKDMLRDDIPNTIYTSETYNPFFFPLIGINTVGDGEILGLAAATKALSEGQFGQFPLYAFTTEGVWALELMTDGHFSSVQPVTRDTCIGKNAITSADNSVLFLTRRGLVLLSGNSCTSISEELKNNSFISYQNFPSIDEIIIRYGLDDMEDNKTFEEYLADKDDVGILYDYIGKRIFVYNRRYKYAYIYNIETETWGKVRCNIINTLNSYPNSYVVINDYNTNKIADFSNRHPEGEYNCAFLTRPISFGEKDIHKTIRTIIQNGRFKTDKIKQVLYGSNDLTHWFVVRSSNQSRMTGFTGTPYKHFIIAVIATLGNDEYIEGCNVEYETKLTNKLR